MSEVNDAFIEELRQAIEQAEPAEPSEPEPQYVMCQCGQPVLCQAVHKQGKNKGRPFASCNNCLRFQWLDLPVCTKCGERYFAANVRKDGPNRNRPFQACPSGCKGKFDWLDLGS